LELAVEVAFYRASGEWQRGWIAMKGENDWGLVAIKAVYDLIDQVKRGGLWRLMVREAGIVERGHAQPGMAQEGCIV
jgi:hypothetical protein